MSESNKRQKLEEVSDESILNEEEKIKSKFVDAGQGHVFKYYSTLPKDEKISLLKQLHTIDVDTLSAILKSALNEQIKTQQLASNKKGAGTEEKETIKPFSKDVVRTYDDNDKGAIDESYNEGLQAIKRGEVAALVLAGGQGTRLGFDGPKGMYNIGLPSNKSLFQMICERLARLCELAASTTTTKVNSTNDDGKKNDNNINIPFYIMTSPINHDDTVKYFKDNNYFGLPSSNVKFFQQGMLPCLQKVESDDDASKDDTSSSLMSMYKIIMETKSKVSEAPDGNGGIYPSLDKSGTLQEMKDRGIKFLHVFSIDNALVKPADPIFMGYCIKEKADCGNKVLWKSHAHEKVGVIVEKNNKPCIVEYSDITKEMAERTDDKTGRLVFGAGNICNHFYTIDFINDIVLPNIEGNYHIAHKKIPFYDEGNGTVKPTSNNGIKLETFIFDVFPLSESMAIVDVNREEEFAPVKNAPGSTSDSPDTARIMISSLAKTWIINAGGKLKYNENGSNGGSIANDSIICEVSPLASYGGEGLEKEVEGKEIECPFLIKGKHESC